MHRTCSSTIGIAAGCIVPGSPRTRCEPNVKSVEEHAVGIIWIHHDSLIVPVLVIVASTTPAVSERAALRTLHESPARPAISRRPGTNLAARVIAAAAIGNNRLALSIDVIRITRRDSNIDSAQLITGIDINKGRATAGIHWRPSRVGAAGDRIAKDEPISVARN